MYDIHSHIIYGVDDGSPDRETSRKLLRVATQGGTTHIVATPHVSDVYDHVDWESIVAGVEELRTLAWEENLDLQIYPGAEVMLSLDILNVYDEAPQAYCLNDTNYALVELPRLEISRYTEDMFEEMQLRGLRPILAHAERYLELYSVGKRLLGWCRQGVLLQINGGSLLGQFGEAVRDNAELLLRNRLVSVIGSDAHDITHRNTDLSQAYSRLLNLVGHDYADRICFYNPETILSGGELYVDVPRKLRFKPKKTFLQRIFS